MTNKRLVKICTALICSIIILSCNSKSQKKADDATHKALTYQKSDTLFKAFGDFDIQLDKLNLNIPVFDATNAVFSLEEVHDVSSPNTNALLVRVSNKKDIPLSATRANRVLQEIKSLRDIGLDINLLASHKKLKVIVFHSVDAFSIDEIESLRKCPNNYSENSCLDAVRNKNDKEDFLLPNDRNGSILKGN